MCLGENVAGRGKSSPQALRPKSREQQGDEYGRADQARGTEALHWGRTVAEHGPGGHPDCTLAAQGPSGCCVRTGLQGGQR